VLSAAGNAITVIDSNPARLAAATEDLDVRTLVGDCSFAHILLEAGAEDADLVVAATSHDQVNLLTAALAKSAGTKRTIARVHQTEYFRQQGFDYQGHLGVDRLICPEYSTAIAIAQSLHNPSAQAIENFGAGNIEIEQFPAGENAAAVGSTLAEVPLPAGSRLAVLVRNGEAFVPDGSSRVNAGDKVLLVGNADVFDDARRLFRADGSRRRIRVVIMGGPEMAVWLCQALRSRAFAVRLFETDRQRAEELAAELSWVTVLNADPTERATFLEEHVGEADVFVAIRNDDEDNIIACVLAKVRGVERTIAVVQGSNYLEVINDIGVDRAYSPRLVAARQIEGVLDDSGVRILSSYPDGDVSVYRTRIGESSELIGRRLRTLKLTPDWSIIGVRRGLVARVPSADDDLAPGDTVLVIGRSGREDDVRVLFDA
ncbi:MAG: Trk system potassium transporter TrkA, partial [Phycisphaerales bacterium]|nr:Trk system potassium transporter TrkA [Phycisphaerales bacterium]